MRSSPAVRSILNLQASCTISASTRSSVSNSVPAPGDACDQLGLAGRTENLVGLAKAECSAVLLHELAILFRALSSHLGGPFLVLESGLGYSIAG